MHGIFDLSDGLVIGKMPTFYFFKFAHKQFLLIIIQIYEETFRLPNELTIFNKKHASFRGCAHYLHKIYDYHWRLVSSDMGLRAFVACLW